MATRRHASDSGVNWTLVIVPVLVAALGAGAYFLFFSGKNENGSPEPKESPRTAFAFSQVNTRYYRTGKKPQGQEFEVAAGNANGMMNAYYDAAFVNPDAWQGGTFPDVLAQFAPSAGEQAAADLAILTLGPESAQVDSVTPGTNSLQITVLLDREGLPTSSVAFAQFQGTGKLASGGDLAIAHRASYFLRKVDGAWKIIGYDVDTNLDSGGGTGATGPGSAGGSPVPEETTTP